MIYFDRERLLKEKKDIEAEMAAGGFWDDKKNARKKSQKLDRIKKRLKVIEELEEKFEEAEIYFELAAEEAESLDAELKTTLRELEKKLEKLELKLRLNEPYDDHNAILSIHPGAGGTESQDWAQMLLRMYSRWAEANDYELQTLDFNPGEEAGIKSVTMMINGDYAYGYLKGEKGVHRLVRISPFDSSGRRHTSFASVDVMPEIDDDLEVDIDENDLKIDTYRASGAGGQHVNKTDSAVRITHLPTGVVVQCQNERSQHKNKATAMKILTSKLLELKEEAQAEKIDELGGEHKEIAWGSQIRSYVFHPYNMIKDHRTDFEEGNVDKVMDGYLDEFIEAYLKYKSTQ
ncbi:MAG: peptide chain release factor 2 [Halanaerobium sp. 4-GBenrich]|uniref:Peptide chain release factor 2 n=1 Tax=Halanaerobium congolense TaxID=54121 RepID=A0A1G6RVL8_9FIRM|nr:MAG: peptide chain release factor 2 [Halanaerobium sp. T82-1]ODS50624.1 MAG: peptide chain release factor 2 [Halanaerobium sp. 4-GBenrich]PUU91256.1 MAG: peptide chain release factor 2 [Halanaerobium sp.]PXV70014.1 peptide chain release factor 2 (bRF-2) [Halanaerobium congolense]TDP24222.1 peptide chain release factor 2 (bRF-2) [Halanaerobium congolense]